MILTYKLKHGQDYTEELKKAKQVAEFSLVHKTFSSKDVKHIGLKSVISNQILRKYSRNRNLKHINHVNLTIPNQGIKLDKEQRIIRIPSLNLSLHYQFPNRFSKVNQIEVDNGYASVSVTIPEEEPRETDKWIGVDLNTTGHIAVIANPETGKVKKLGKKAEHVHKKYKNIRRQLQKAGKYKLVKQIRSRESRIVRDMNHKISKEIVEEAKAVDSGIKLEKLEGIRRSKTHRKSFRYSLHSWLFYQLQQMIEYKAKLLGVPIEYVDPAYTSQRCSRCGKIGKRVGKEFNCPHCRAVEHADVNAAFNISSYPSIDRFVVDRDATKGSTDAPRAAIVWMPQTAEPPML